MQTISEYYNGVVEKEDSRLSECSAEFGLTWALIQKHLKKIKGNRILDLGGGTGVYAIPLAEQGRDVLLVDISECEIKYAKHKAREKNVEMSVGVQDARVFEESLRGEFDLVLCLGPLYHASSLQEIKVIISNLLEYVKENGKIIMAFLSKDSKICDFIKKFDKKEKQDIKKVMTHFYEHTDEEKVIFFEKRGELPVSFVNISKIDTLFADLNVQIDEIVCVDYINDIPTEMSEKEIDFFLELGKGIYLKNGSHILVTAERGKQNGNKQKL